MHDAVGVRVGEVSDEQRLKRREHGRIHSNPERQREHGHGGKPGVLQQLSDGKTECVHNKLIENCASLSHVKRTFMKVSHLKKKRDRAPFRAFQLHLTNGEILPVRHPDYMNLPPEEGTNLFVVWIGSDWNLLDAEQVTRVSLDKSKSGHAKP